jgi:tetratricopeptide (TPR) repeat protein
LPRYDSLHRQNSYRTPPRTPESGAQLMVSHDEIDILHRNVNHSMTLDVNSTETVNNTEAAQHNKALRFVCRSTFVVWLLIVAVAQTLAQSTENKFRLAQSYEQGGDFESAVKLYKELYIAEPTNSPFFDGLRRSYIFLKRYDEAIGLIRNQLTRNKNDANLFCLLASALYQAGNEKEANAAWESAVASDPKNANIYRLVANSLLENRLLEKTAELYRRARTTIGDETLFTLDLAYLLGVMMDYHGATIEYLRYLAPMPTQLGYVQNRLAQFTGKPEALAAAIEAVRSAGIKPDELTTQRLLGWLILEGKNYADAFEVYKTIDRLANAQGVELYAFGDRAYKEGAYAIAAEAYKAAAEVLPKDRRAFAQFGLALATKELTTLGDTSLPPIHSGSTIPEAQSRYATAIDYFRAVIAERPNTDLAAKAHYHIGRIQFEKHFDLDGALASFAGAESSLSAVRFDVAIKCGEVLTAKADTASAAARFRQVIGAPNATPDQQDEATFRLAELAYFGGNVSEAMDLLGSISANVKADYTNDALQLLSFLQENTAPMGGTSEAQLKEFARADFLARQHKNTEAISLLQHLINKNPQALFVDEGWMRIAMLQTHARLYTDALASYQKLLDTFSESSIALDKAQFNIARLYDVHLKDKPNAIAAYERLLATYPQSLLVDAARKRIRELRGDSL